MVRAVYIVTALAVAIQLVCLAWVAAGDDSLCVGDECWIYEPAEEDPSNLWFINTADAIWFEPPECPPDFGPVKIEVPEGRFEYEWIEVECGRVVYE